MDKINKTFEQCAKDEVGKIYADWMDGDCRCIVMRGPVSICAYVGVRQGHPLYQVDYNDIDIDCHGGLTFSRGGNKYRPLGYWWLGWDYGHYGDKAFYYLDPRMSFLSDNGEHGWTPDEVLSEIPDVLKQLNDY